MQSISQSFTRHQMVVQININYVCDLICNVQPFDIIKQLDRRIFCIIIPSIKFGNHGFASFKSKEMAVTFPPFPCPISSCNHFRFIALLIKEARNTGFNVNYWFHILKIHLSSHTCQYGWQNSLKSLLSGVSKALFLDRSFCFP